MSEYLKCPLTNKDCRHGVIYNTTSKDLEQCSLWVTVTSDSTHTTTSDCAIRMIARNLQIQGEKI